MKIWQDIKSALVGATVGASVLLAGQQLVEHEGVRSHVYTDTVGVPTVGIGRNVTRGFSPDEIAYLFKNDLNEATEIAQKFAAESWEKLNAPRQAALINLAFNLGETRLFKFVKTRSALLAHDYKLVAERLGQSLWCKQVGRRCEVIKMQFEKGEVQK